MPDRARTRELAAEFISRGEPLGWFDALYQESQREGGAPPWADQEPNPGLTAFWKAHPQETVGKRALVIGSGYGDDAEQLAAWGFATTGFDISKTAIAATKKRYPNTKVEYAVADLFDPPAAWLRKFDFVIEVYTVQALVGDLRARAINQVAQFVAPGGHLLVIARGREENEPEGPGPPGPLTRAELEGFRRAGLEEVSFEEYADSEPPWVRRFRALYRRAESAT